MIEEFERIIADHSEAIEAYGTITIALIFLWFAAFVFVIDEKQKKKKKKKTTIKEIEQIEPKNTEINFDDFFEEAPNKEISQAVPEKEILKVETEKNTAIETPLKENLEELKIENLKHFLKEEEAQDKAYFLKLYFSLSYTGRKELLRNDEFFRNIAGKPHLQKLIQKIDNDKEKIPIEEFFELRSKTMSENRKNKESHLSWQYSGVYILHNETTDKYYVGQSTNLFRRIPEHFKNWGSHSVYSSYTNGDEWFIKTVLLSETDFPSLNVLERSAIYYYKSYENGYNQTPGDFI